MLAILTTHPIQYQVPLWQALAQDGRVPFEVWYLTDQGTRSGHDREFGQGVFWDLDMLSGYPYRFLDVARGAAPDSFLKCRLRERLRDRLRTSGARTLWIQGWQVGAYWQAVWEAKAAGVEVWLRGESNHLAATPILKCGVKRLLLGQFFRRVDRFLCIGAANRRLYQKYGVPDHRLHSAPYAVDSQRFAQQATALRGQRAEIRRLWHIPDDAFCVLFCGKFIDKKRPLDLVKAAQLLIATDAMPDIHLLFVGSGDLSGAIRASCHSAFDAATSNPAPRAPDPKLPKASFAGFLSQTEISKAYVAADCLVLPSDHGETWGLVVNEAQASDLACVVSDACGCAEDLICSIDPRSCFRYSDIRGLVTAISYIRGNPPKSDAVRLTRERHSIAATVEVAVKLHSGRAASRP